MKIIILGAGAIGSFYGARLSEHFDVTLIGKKKHVDLINEKGLRVTVLEDKTYKIKAATSVDKIDPNTLIILATKVYDSEKVITEIKDKILDDTVILCMQNGLKSEEIVKKVVNGKCLVLRGITNYGCAYVEPGVVQYNSEGYTLIEKSSRSEEVNEVLNKGNLKSQVSNDIQKDVWEKLILNCALNPLSAILRVENKDLAKDSLNPLKQKIVDECLLVCGKLGIKFDIDFVSSINSKLAGSTNIASMQQDILKGKRTEIDYLNGAVVKLGQEFGIECPVNESLVKIIKEIEKK